MLSFTRDASGRRLQSLTQGTHRPFSPLSPRVNIHTQHRWLARTFAGFRLCGELLPILGTCGVCRTCPTGTCCQGRCSNVGIARATKSFHRKDLVFETSSPTLRRICRRQRGYKLSGISPPLGIGNRAVSESEDR